jgi:hypothetical protein
MKDEAPSGRQVRDTIKDYIYTVTPGAVAKHDEVQ